MELNWTIEVFINLGVCFLLLLLLLIVYRSPNIKNLKSTYYLNLGFINYELFYLFELLSDLLLIRFLAIIGSYFIFSGNLFFIVAINYIMKDHFFSYGLLVLVSLGTLYFYSGLLPDSIILVRGQDY